MALNFSKMDYWGDSIPYRPHELSYIKQVSLPIADTPIGAKIKARSMDRMSILEASLPNRDTVRKQNYDRRMDQMHNQGFVSLIEKPYRAIGHPVYLDNKRLITDTLGLPHQESDRQIEKSVTPTSSVSGVDPLQTPFMLRRSRKQLNTLKKEIERGRSLLRNVKLGHGLFKVLADEWSKTMQRREVDQKLEKQRAMMDWQLARSNSESGSDSNEELNEEEDLRKYFVQIQVTDYSKQEPDEQKDHVRFTSRPETHIGHSTDTRVSHDRLMSAPVRRRKGHSPRPFTPNHSNISQKKPQAGRITGETLFRQLCCLHWMLKAMDLPEHCTITPLINCWELNSERMGGDDLNKRILEDKKRHVQTEYDHLFRLPRAPRGPKRNRSRPDKKRNFYPPRNYRSGSIGFRSRSDSCSQSLQSIEVPSTPVAEAYATLEEPTRGVVEGFGDMASTIVEETPDDYDSLTVPSSIPAITVSVATGLAEGEPSRPSTRQPIVVSTSHEFGKLTREEEKQVHLAKQLEEAAKMDNAPMERLPSKLFRASDALKPKSSKELLEFKSSCISSKLVHRNKEMKQSWAEVKEERALRLHDELDSQEKNRLMTCQNKYTAMKTDSSSFHRALKTMRIQSEHKRREVEKEKNKIHDQSKYAKWYEELIQLVPKDCVNLWYFQRILDKLRIYGDKYGPDNKTESSSKANEHKFSKMLRLIRSWEICSPNVAAAVEFCRDRIIEMSEQDFEDLFQHTFPSIERPKTAPAKSNSSR